MVDSTENRYVPRIARISERAEPRGSSFTVPMAAIRLLGTIRDIHFAEIHPGCVRGNHYHAQHHEVLCIRFFDRWSLHWKPAAGGRTETESFAGAGLILVEVEPLIAHAILNDGERDLHVIGLSNKEFNPQEPDSLSLQIV